MKTSAIGIAVLAILFSCPPVNGEDLTDAEIAARDFTYQGVGIGTTLQEFKIRFPDARLIESDKSSMTSNYACHFVSKSVDFIFVDFFREKIYNIAILIPSKKLSEIGGRPVLEKKIVGTFGRPDTAKGGVYIWRFPRVHMAVGYDNRDSSDYLGIRVFDTDIEEKVTAIKARNLNLGF